MLGESFRYPLRDGDGRDAVAVCSGLVLAALLLVRLAAALWPSPLAALPGLLVVLPAALFAGYVGGVLVADAGTSAARGFSWSRRTLRVGLRLVVVAVGYLLPAAVALAVTAFVLIGGGGGPLLTVAPTVALLVTVAAVYVLPAALATGTRRLRAAFSRSSLGGLASGSYFFAWTVATSLVVSVWSLLAAVASATPAAVVLAVVFAYVHVVAARILHEGLERSPWSLPGG
jgi:hypothetical protein